ncbi:hypothetical protein MTQ00_12350 [Chryseobacterium sp. B21-037]|uniref:hypothetical protein n=1 Tax=Chryseobacterium sp. B21-037 TaxID=2926038 RepID=UPI002359FC4E|nr:hypothetical protein [Chryseobacterium sp. B21-037]MDC8105334.1 hypothetical protein [Chryseobacterium sp. B21-037]
MSSLPKWINDAVENLLPSKFKDCTVTKATYISDDLKQITFETDLSDVYFEPAYAVGFRINDRDFRNYSPFHFDKEKEILISFSMYMTPKLQDVTSSTN